MPPLPTLKLPVLVDLAGQLRFAPGDVARRAIERTESLAGEIDPSATYPDEWIVFRITRYRPESALGREARLVTGSQLLAELSPFVEHLCASASMREEEVLPAPTERGATGHSFVSLDELARRWGVSRKTIDRCRRAGLVARRVTTPRGKTRLFISISGAEAFRARHGDKLGRAAAFSRIDEQARQRILRRAARYRRRFNCSLNQIAARLAPKFGRSHEAIRQVLKRSDRSRAGPHAAETAPDFAGEHSISLRERRFAYRAWQRAIEPADVARRLGHRKPAILRAVLLERLARLRELIPHLQHHTGPTFTSPEAEKTILAPAPVRSGLGASGQTLLADFLAAARTRTVPVGAEDAARSVAYHFLLWRAVNRVEAVSHLQPSASAIDAIETDLRWAARLKVELIRSQLPLLVQTLEGRLETTLSALRPADSVLLVSEGLATVAEAVHVYDPFRAASTGARIAGSVSPPITRLAAQWSRRLEAAASASKSRATAVYSGRVAIIDWTLGCAPWQALLEPRPGLRAALKALAPAEAAFLGDRYGWSGGPPITLAALASQLSTTAMHVAARERLILQRALAALRNPPQARVE